MAKLKRRAFATANAPDLWLRLQKLYVVRPWLA